MRGRQVSPSCACLAAHLAPPVRWIRRLAGIGRRQGPRALLAAAIFKPWIPRVAEMPWNAAVFQYARFRRGRLDIQGFVPPLAQPPPATLAFSIRRGGGGAVLSITAGLTKFRHDGDLRQGYRFRFELDSRFLPGAFRCQAGADREAVPLVVHWGTFFPIPKPYRHAALTTPDGLQLRRLADGRFAIARPAAVARFWREFLYCLELLRGRTAEEWTAVALRLAVHVWRRVSRRRHWVFSDKLDNPFDSAYAAAQALVTAPEFKPANIGAYYLIDRHRPITRRLDPGIRPMRHLTLKHAFLYLTAEANITSEGGYSPFSRRASFYQDLLACQVRVWSGHGIIHHDLTALYGKDHQNFSLMTTGVAREREYLLGGTWGYDADEVVLTGLARWDFRASAPAKKIYFIFTWRANLVAGSDPRTLVRCYDDSFASSDYLRKIEGLLSNPALLDAAREGGYTLCFVPHPLVRPALRYFSFPPQIRVESEETPYESIYRDASLLVTDYSSIAMDMAYLGTPVVYYQFDREAFYARQGYTPSFYSWEEDGFGEICREHDETVACIIRYLQSGCARPEHYAARARAFFPPQDKRNGVRTCEAVLAKLEQWGCGARRVGSVRHGKGILRPQG
jgi:hypothetical protein